MSKLISAILAIIMAIMSLFGINPATTLGRARSVELSTLKNLPNIAAQAQVSRADSAEAITSLTDNDGLTMQRFKKGDSIFMNFDNEITLNTIIIEELLDKKGVNINTFEGGTKLFTIFAEVDGAYELIYQNDKIDEYRLCTFDPVTTKSIKISFDDCRGSATIKEISLYNVGKVKMDFRVNGYLPVNYDKNYALDLNFMGYLTAVTDVTIFGGIYINDSGSLTFSKGEDVFAKKLSEIKLAALGKDIKLYCNVFSGDADPSFFSGKTELIAKNLTDFLVKYELDGIDFDWEYPETEEDWNVFNRLILDIDKNFEPLGKKISAAVATWTMGFSDEAKKAVDYYNVMVYDFMGIDSESYHSTFKAATSSIEQLIDKGYAREKICLGSPYYGREMSKYAPERPATWPCYRDSGFTTKWENINYTTDANGNKIPYDSFNGYAMIADKTAYAISMSLGGVMSWHMESDMAWTNPLSLHRAVNETVKDRIEK